MRSAKSSRQGTAAYPFTSRQRIESQVSAYVREEMWITTENVCMCVFRYLVVVIEL